MFKVLKFGGSSMADANQYKKVKDIVLAESSRKVVVVSAAGKRFSGDNKITDLLYLCYAHLQYGVCCDNIFEMISDRYIQIRNDLKLTTDIESELEAIKAKMKKGITQDELASRGEYLSALLLADYLGFKFVDATDWLTFKFDGNIDTEKSYSKLQNIPYEKGIVIPGFYGIMPNATIRVMTRGGSDITGALAAAAFGADIYENWTDVSGVLMADPRIVDNPKPIKRITYDELRELSCMGAQVLHPGTIFPVKKANIPLNIRNTNAPDDPGTIIMRHCDDTENDANFITGIAGRNDFSIVTVSKHGLSTSVGFLRRAAEKFERNGASIEYVSSDIDALSFVLPTESVRDKLYNIIADIENELKPDKIDVTDNISIIAVVGRKMAFKPGTSGKLFAMLGQKGINIRMISQGPDERNIIVGTDNKDYEKTIRAIYDSFIK